MLPEFYKYQRIWASFFYNYDDLREVQKKAITPIFNGKNAFIISGTGSGKTEAAVAPLVARYYEYAIEKDCPFLIYITPTKALANDLKKRLEGPIEDIGLILGIKHGDKNDLKKQKKPHIILTTPESLDVLLYKKDIILAHIKAIIFDELHFLYNTQRGLHLAILFNRLKAFRGEDVQWVALSATISNPDNYLSFFFPNVEKPSVEIIKVPNQRSLYSVVCTVSKPVKLIRNLLFKNGLNKILVFTNSRNQCEELVQILKEDNEIKDLVYCHYSSLSPEVRKTVEQEFANNKCGVCVSTSTLELGIDIGDIDSIVLWDVPPNVESFLQRLGRGNRRKRTNYVVCAIPGNKRNKLLSALRFMSLNNLAINGILPEKKPYNLIGAIAQQFLSIVASNEGRFIQRRKLYESIKFLEYVDEKAVYKIIDELLEKGFLIKHDFYDSYGATEKLYELVDSLEIYSNVGGDNGGMKIKCDEKELGKIPKENNDRLRIGDQIKYAGKIWEIVQIKHDLIKVKPATKVKSLADITYYDVSPLSEAYVIENIWRLIHYENLNEMIKQTIFNKSIETKIVDLITTIKNNFSYFSIPFIKLSERYVYYTFAGELINSVISHHFNEGISDYDDIRTVVSNELNWNEIDNIIAFEEDYIYRLIRSRRQANRYQKLLPDYLQKKEIMEEFKKDISYITILSRLKKSSAKQIKEHDIELISELSA